MKEAIVKLRSLPFVSVSLVGINVIIFLICNFTGPLLYNMGRLNVADVFIRKDYFRIIWSMFLHSDVNHIFNNMLILLFLGAMIEKEIGHIRFCVLYFLSGIGGGIFSLFAKAMNNDWSGSIGASGAVFGMDGVLLALVLFSHHKLPTVTPARVVFMIAYSLYSGFTGQNIDNAAHIGGLLAGFLAGTLMCLIQRRRSEQN